MKYKNIFRIKRFSTISTLIFALALLISSATGANAALTFGTATISADGNLTEDGVAASAFSYGPSITTGSFQEAAGLTSGTYDLGGTATTGTITLGKSLAAQTVNLQNVANTGAQTLNIHNGATAANVTVGVLSGTGTAGAGTLNLGNNPRLTTATLANGANAAAMTVNIASGAAAADRTVTISGGVPTTGTDTLNLATGNYAKAVNIATGTKGNTVNVGTGVNDTAQTVNIATGAAGADSTVNILTGVATAGTQALNLGTGLSAKTVTLGNISGATAVNINTGTGGSTITTTGAGDFTVASGDDVVINGGGASAAVGIGTTAVAHTINVGTGTAGNTVNIATDNTAADTIAVGSALDLLSLTSANWSVSAAGVTSFAGSTFTDLTATGNVTMNDASADNILIGAAADTVTLTSNTLSLTDDNWSVTAAGVANFVSVGATTAGTGAFTTLSSTGATTIGNNSATVAINSSDWDINATGDMTGIGAITADGTITSGGTFTGSAATTYDAGGAAAITIGSVDVTSLTVTTDGTGTAEVALPAGSIDSTEILNGTIVNADIADTTIDLTAKVTGVLPTANGGTGIAFFTAAGPTAARVYTFPDADSTILVSGGALGTPSSGTLTNATGLPVSGITASTTTALGVGSVELGHASDTTIARSGAGAITVEGVQVLLSGAALGTPASGTLTNATGLPVSGITSSTTTALGLGSVELGHASDTTIARSGAGAITVEGTQVLLSGAALGTPASGTATNLTGLPLTTGVTGILPTANGGTGIAFFTAAGPTAARVYTFPDADSTILVSGGALGTPSSGTLTNATGLPVSGITASTTTALGVGSVELGHASDTTIARSGAGAITVEGVQVLLSGAALGTPASGTLTNATGLPIATGVAGLGANVATALATPSSANLITAVTDETGSGALVFANTPTLVTPALGAATATSVAIGGGTALTKITVGNLADDAGGNAAGWNPDGATLIFTVTDGAASVGANSVISISTGADATVTGACFVRTRTATTNFVITCSVAPANGATLQYMIVN